jgi:hypothetical protein
MIGRRVRIARLLGDELGDRGRLGQVGTIARVVKRRGEGPTVVVRFDDGGEDTFYEDELALYPRDGGSILERAKTAPHGTRARYVSGGCRCRRCKDSIVAGGRESVSESARWVPELAGVAPLYLAVQDGMSADDVRELAPSCAGLFVGGTLEWKLATGARWVRAAHALGLACHVGRVGTMGRIAWARRIGADSIDSCLPLWSAAKLDRFLRALHSTQTELPFRELP